MPAVAARRTASVSRNHSIRRSSPTHSERAPRDDGLATSGGLFGHVPTVVDRSRHGGTRAVVVILDEYPQDHSTVGRHAKSDPDEQKPDSTRAGRLTADLNDENVDVPAVDPYSNSHKNRGGELFNSEFATVVAIFRPFEFEFDAQLFRPVCRAFAFGFHLERGLRRGVERYGVTACLKCDCVTGVEFIHDCLEVRCDLFSAHPLLRLEENFLWHTASDYVTRVIKRICPARFERLLSSPGFSIQSRLLVGQ